MALVLYVLNAVLVSFVVDRAERATRTAGTNLSDAAREELLATADQSLATLSRLVTDLLDVSRVQAGVLAVSLQPVDSAAIVLAALEELRRDPRRRPRSRSGARAARRHVHAVEDALGRS